MRISWVLCYTYDLGKKIHSFKSDSGRGKAVCLLTPEHPWCSRSTALRRSVTRDDTRRCKRDFFIDAHSLPRAATRVQISGSAASDAAELLCRTAERRRRWVLYHQPLSSWSEPRAAVFLTQHRPTREDPGQKHTDGCFFLLSFVLFSKRELYWNEILLIGKILTEQTSKRYFEILMEKKNV